MKYSNNHNHPRTVRILEPCVSVALLAEYSKARFRYHFGALVKSHTVLAKKTYEDFCGRFLLVSALDCVTLEVLRSVEKHVETRRESFSFSKDLFCFLTRRCVL